MQSSNRRGLLAPLFLTMALLVLPRQLGAAREDTVFSAVSAASGTSTPFRTAGYAYVRFQVCGTGFTGTVTALQGAKSTTTTSTRAVTITGLTGCSVYYKLNPAAWGNYSYTRSAGTLSLYQELAP